MPPLIRAFPVRFLLVLLLVFRVSSADAFIHTLEFVRNAGQWNGSFLYRGTGANRDVLLWKNGFGFVLRPDADTHPGALAKPGKSAGYQVEFEHASPDCRITESKQEPQYYNYFLGSDTSRWKSGLHPCRVLTYESLYPGIDLRMSSESQKLKYEFIAAPGADLKPVSLHYIGARRLRLSEGDLVIGTDAGEVRELKPYAYQVTERGRKTVRCRFVLEGERVRYAFPDGYDSTLALVIDPTVVFATFTGSSADNWGFTATYDSQGNYYGGGIVHLFTQRDGNLPPGNFPFPAQAFDTTYGGGSDTAGNEYRSDIVVFKYNASGSAFIYATFLGGRDNEQPHSLIVDDDNNLIMAGRTYSANYPVTTGSFDNSYNGAGDFVVTKLNATGTALIASTYIGGDSSDAVNYDARETVPGPADHLLKHNYGDDARSEVLLDRQGNIYVAGPTRSPNFPLASPYQDTLGGDQDGIVFKFNPSLSTLLWSTYLGGSDDDACYVLEFNPDQSSVYVAGGTQSSNFPVSAGAFGTTRRGATDGFITRFQNGGAYPLQRSTLIGAGGYDQCYGLEADIQGNIYVMGQTLGGGFPVTSGVYSNPGSSQFVMKLDGNLSGNIFSTVYGSGNPNATNISPVAFLVDTCENIYISGWGGSPAGFIVFPNTTSTTGMPISGNPYPAAQSTTDGNDFFFIILGKNAASLLYGTYMGGPASREHVDGGTSRYDRNGIIYQAICGGCGGKSDFPTTPGSVSPTNGSVNCNLIAVKIAFNIGAVKAQAVAGPVTHGCRPLTVNFQNNSTNGISYIWDFGDGAQSTQTSPTHTYTKAGVFQVRLVTNNANACLRVTDTAYTTITVDSNEQDAIFNYQVTIPCKPYQVRFTNGSTYNGAPSANADYRWFFGDGTDYAGPTPPLHTYSNPGTYTVKLVMTDTMACNNPDTAFRTFTVQDSIVKAGLALPSPGCDTSAVQFLSNARNAASFRWSFGDGTSSTDENPVHKYTGTGTFTVKQVAINEATCNKRDSSTGSITIDTTPYADFDFSPRIPEANTATRFANKSKNATSYIWSFGDGDGSTEVSPLHLFRKSGSYTVCLTAQNESGCSDTVCKSVEADIRPLADVPSAFTPNGDQNGNDILYVRGGAIQTLDFRVYNRWGELVFSTVDLSKGWDGTYRGKPQPVDAYAYTLNVTFIDGTAFFKKGNVTLLR